ncbi:MAG: type IV pilus modification protein PilV [Cellvibrionaceae bacterium]|nr:type IV pilus modification protein PilV [Cellvibrionaceae bacterium]
MSIANRLSPRASHAGSTMIETLVALLILAVGLLSIQAMQLVSLRTNTSSYLRTEAQLLAEDITDRILAYEDITDPADNDDYDGIDTDNGAADPGCGVVGCTQAQQLALDTFEWKTEIESRLPGGRGTVVFNAGAYDLTVMWDNDKTGANGTGCSGNTDVDLTCYTVQLNL